MADTSEIQQPPLPPGSIWIVRVIALVFLLCLSVDFVATASFYLRPCLESPWVKVPMMLTAIPFLIILIKLRARTRKAGLALAACWGGAVSLIFGPLFLHALGEGSDVFAYRVLFLLVCLLHTLLFTSAVRALRSLPREATDLCTFVLAFCGTPFLLLLAMTGMADRARPSHKRAYLSELTAIFSLERIQKASESYASNFDNGYPASLAILGPSDGKAASCVNAGLIEERQAKGEWGGYDFDYRPGPAIGRPIPGCPPGAQTYTVSARPREFERSGCRSFFLDELGLIHYTYENRAATVADSKLDW